MCEEAKSGQEDLSEGKGRGGAREIQSAAGRGGEGTPLKNDQKKRGGLGIRRCKERNVPEGREKKRRETRKERRNGGGSFITGSL